MRLSIRILSEGVATWSELLGEIAPPFRLNERDEELVFHRPHDGVVGVRLIDDEGSLLLELPTFASPVEMGFLKELAIRILAATRGEVTIGDRPIPTGRFVEAFDQHAIPQFAEHCSRELTTLAKDGGSTIEIDGYARPYFLGARTARRVFELAPEAPYAKLLEQIGSIQRLAPPTRFPIARRVRTPDGIVATYAAWDPRRETVLLPPCDFLLLEDEAVTMRIASAAIEDALGRHGVPIDEHQWLLFELSEANATSVCRLAATIGERIHLP